MYNTKSSLTVTNVTFLDNTATVVAGGLFNDTSSPTLNHVSFINNSARYGGGMYNNAGSSPTLTDDTFFGNSASRDGGGMYIFASSPALTNVTFANNVADFGGGISIDIGSPSLTNVVFSQNSALMGGGIQDNMGSPKLINTTFSANSALEFGGAMNDESSSPSLVNCVLWGNLARNGAEIAGTAMVSYSDVKGGWSGSGNIQSNPDFVGAADGDLRLKAGSPAIDRGTNTGAPGFDRGDQPRPVDGSHRGFAITDMGAYEYQPHLNRLTVSAIVNVTVITTGNPELNKESAVRRSSQLATWLQAFERRHHHFSTAGAIATARDPHEFRIRTSKSS
jgi:hypothetical protein